MLDEEKVSIERQEYTSSSRCRRRKRWPEAGYAELWYVGEVVTRLLLQSSPKPASLPHALFNPARLVCVITHSSCCKAPQEAIHPLVQVWAAKREMGLNDRNGFSIHLSQDAPVLLGQQGQNKTHTHTHKHTQTLHTRRQAQLAITVTIGNQVAMDESENSAALLLLLLLLLLISASEDPPRCLD